MLLTREEEAEEEEVKEAHTRERLGRFSSEELHLQFGSIQRRVRRPFDDSSLQLPDVPARATASRQLLRTCRRRS